jgi:ElaB/YqjD/DUF883 family membrane-anchored ribosome-binding protein
MSSDVSRASSQAATAVDSLKGQVGDAVTRARDNVADTVSSATDGLAGDVAKLREDMASIQQTLTKFASQAGGQAVKTVQDVSSAVAGQVGGVASQVGDVASEYAASARDGVKTFTSELETMARKNPLGAIGATLLVGVVIGMMSRSRD